MNHSIEHKSYGHWPLISFILYLISLALPPICLDNSCLGFGGGVIVLLYGVFALGASLANMVLLANLFLWVSWIFYKRKCKLSLIFSAIASVIAFSFLFFDEIVYGESYEIAKITGYHAGYWVWLLSMIVMVWGNIKRRESKSSDQSDTRHLF